MTAAQKADNSLAIEDILVDVGAVSRDEVVSELGIQVGDPIMPDVTFEYDEERGLCMGKDVYKRQPMDYTLWTETETR